MKEYVEAILNSQFPQSHFMTVEKFIKYVNQRELFLTKKELEYYDKKGLIRPILMLRRLKEHDPLKKLTSEYQFVDIDIFSIQQYYKNGLVEFPEEQNYQAWSNYNRIAEDIELLYHPFQIIQVNELFSIIKKPLDLESLENVENYSKGLENILKKMKKRLETAKIREKHWIDKLSLLIILDEAYGPYVKNIPINKEIDSYIEKYSRWRLYNFSANNILQKIGFSIDKIKEMYIDLCWTTKQFDPLYYWFPLIQLIKKSQRNRLQGIGLLAQDYYDYIYMIGNFIFDITGQKMLDPDDITDGGINGKWKEKIYGFNFDYTTKRTRQALLDTYLIDRSFRFGIIFEGSTEETVIDLLLKSLHIDKTRDGFFLHNAEGIANIHKHLEGLFYFAKLEEIELFLIVDNDNESKNLQQRLKMKIDEKNIREWDKDFEYDNFGTDLVVEKVNEMLKDKIYDPVSKDDVISELTKSNKVLMLVIKNILKKKGLKMDELISKKELGKKLIESRLAEIQMEIRFQGWKPKLPLEIFLQELFIKFPRISFA